ncbi:uncharacterized protein LOC110076760 isoform X3 [Pogona vitticeps]
MKTFGSLLLVSIMILLGEMLCRTLEQDIGLISAQQNDAYVFVINLLNAKMIHLAQEGRFVVFIAVKGAVWTQEKKNREDALVFLKKDVSQSSRISAKWMISVPLLRNVVLDPAFAFV